MDMVESFHAVPVLEAWDETPSLRGLRLRLAPDLVRQHVAPGQLLRVRPPEGQAGYFAIGSPPAAGERAVLLVKRGGRIADLVIDAAREGQTLDVTAPFGPGFPASEARDRDVLLFATGSGITPLRALLHQLLVERAARRIVLYYGQRGEGGEGDFAFSREWDGWRRGGADVRLVASRPVPGWPGLTGHVQKVAEATGFGGVEAARSVAYLAGLPQMVAEARDALLRFGLPAGRIFENR